MVGKGFDVVVVVDEASQALEAQCWVALLGRRKVILAGDHLQLPPTVKSTNTKGVKSAGGMTLEQTLFDRIIALYGDGVKRMLTTQYRMHENIMRFPSDELYEGKLVAGEDVKARLLKDLPYGVQDTEDTSEPLVFIDTQGGDFPETLEDEVGKRMLGGESKSNALEAAAARAHVGRLVDAGVRPGDIAVVTPYNAQVCLSPGGGWVLTMG